MFTIYERPPSCCPAAAPRLPAKLRVTQPAAVLPPGASRVKLYTRTPKPLHAGSRVERDRIERLATDSIARSASAAAHASRPVRGPHDRLAPVSLTDLWAVVGTSAAATNNDGAVSALVAAAKPQRRRRVDDPTTAVPAVPFISTLAPSGFSINPEHGAHQTAIAVAVAAELAAEAEAARIAAALAPTPNYVDQLDDDDDDNGAAAGASGAAARATTAVTDAHMVDYEFASVVKTTLCDDGDVGNADAAADADVAPLAGRRGPLVLKRNVGAGDDDAVSPDALALSDNAAAERRAARAMQRRQRALRRPAAATGIAPRYTILPPLSEELTGSLRTTPRVPSGTVATAVMAELVTRGLVAPRTLTAQQRRHHDSKGAVRDIELPRPWRVAEIQRAKRGES